MEASKLSKSSKCQILSSGIIKAVAETIASQKKVSKKSKNAARRLEVYCEGLLEYFEASPFPVFKTNSALNEWKQRVNQLQEVISNWSDNNIVPRDIFINSCLVIAEDVRMTVNDPVSKKFWNQMSQTLFTLYSHNDPLLENIKAMEQGIQMAQDFQKIIHR